MDLIQCLSWVKTMERPYESIPRFMIPRGQSTKAGGLGNEGYGIEWSSSGGKPQAEVESDVSESHCK